MLNFGHYALSVPLAIGYLRVVDNCHWGDDGLFLNACGKHGKLFWVSTYFLLECRKMENKEAWLSLLEGARTVGCYVSGFVDGRDTFKRLLDTFFASTHSSFVVRRSSGSFSSPVRNLVKELLREDLKW